MNKQKRLLTELNTLSFKAKVDHKKINELSEIDIIKFITMFTNVNRKHKFKHVLKYDFSIRLLDNGCFILEDMTHPSLYVTIIFKGKRTTDCYIHRHGQFRYEVQYHINSRVFHTFKDAFDALIPHHYDIVIDSVGYTIIKHLENEPIVYEIVQDGFTKGLFYKTYHFQYEDSSEIELYIWKPIKPKYEYESEKYQGGTFADIELYVEQIPEHFMDIVIDNLNLKNVDLPD